uniref:FtsJ domain-containing protein n=1 Tax=Echinostoma caproni TaxID=27848 RepID=A0A183AC48_9TREM
LAIRVSSPGASLVIKLWQCPEAEPFRKLVSQFYRGPWDHLSSKKNAQKILTTPTKCVRFLKPMASRSDSAEIYLVAKGFVPNHAQQLK